MDGYADKRLKKSIPFMCEWWAIMIVHHTSSGGVVLLDGGEKLSVVILLNKDCSTRGFNITPTNEFGSLLSTVLIEADPDESATCVKRRRLTRVLVEPRSGSRKRVLIFDETED